MLEGRPNMFSLAAEILIHPMHMVQVSACSKIEVYVSCAVLLLCYIQLVKVVELCSNIVGGMCCIYQMLLDHLLLYVFEIQR